MKKKPVINETLCIRCGTCAWVCPGVFSQKLAGEKPEVEDKDDYDKWREKIDEAIDLCPGRAISWEEEAEKD